MGAGLGHPKGVAGWQGARPTVHLCAAPGSHAQPPSPPHATTPGQLTSAGGRPLPRSSHRRLGKRFGVPGGVPRRPGCSRRQWRARELGRQGPSARLRLCCVFQKPADVEVGELQVVVQRRPLKPVRGGACCIHSLPLLGPVPPGPGPHASGGASVCCGRGGAGEGCGQAAAAGAAGGGEAAGGPPGLGAARKPSFEAPRAGCGGPPSEQGLPGFASSSEGRCGEVPPHLSCRKPLLLAFPHNQAALGG